MIKARESRIEELQQLNSTQADVIQARETQFQKLEVQLKALQQNVKTQSEAHQVIYTT